MVRNFLCALVCVSLFGCVVTVTKVMPQYKNMNVRDESLGVIFVKERLVVTNPKDVRDDLGEGEPTTVFGDFFVEEFLKNARKSSRFSDIVMVNNYDPATFNDVTVPINDMENVTLSIPPAGNDDPPFLLVIDRIRMSRVQKVGTPVMGPNGMTNTGSSDNLVLSGTFVVWDTKAKAIVAYGKFNEKRKVFLMMTKTTWSQMVTSVVHKIFVGKPYGKSSSSS